MGSALVPEALSTGLNNKSINQLVKPTVHLAAGCPEHANPENESKTALSSPGWEVGSWAHLAETSHLLHPSLPSASLCKRRAWGTGVHVYLYSLCFCTCTTCQYHEAGPQITGWTTTSVPCTCPRGGTFCSPEHMVLRHHPQRREVSWDRGRAGGLAQVSETLRAAGTPPDGCSDQPSRVHSLMPMH